MVVEGLLIQGIWGGGAVGWIFFSIFCSFFVETKHFLEALFACLVHA